MADIRELIILSPGALDARPETPLVRRLADVRMSLRRAVVSSSRIPLLRRAYLAFYRFHLWIAVQLGKRFAGTRAVYLTSGMSAGDVHLGVSDVDIAIYGDWPEARQFRLMKIFGLFTVLSPLFDRMSIPSIGTMDDLQILCATDMSLALTHARGARGWKLLYGEPVLAGLADIGPERFAGCVYMDIRRWWNGLSGVALGSAVTSRDSIFRNSISFKAAAETLRAESMLQRNDIDTTRRRPLIEEEFARSGDPALGSLLDSASKDYLEIDQDPRQPMLSWFLGRAERFHEQLRNKPYFSIAKPVKITGTAEERTIAAPTMDHAQQLISRARQEWPSLRAAFLLHSASMFSPDSLSLLLEVEGDSIPSLEQLRPLCVQHHAGSAHIPQRLSIYLLLPNAAYQLDARGSLEFFHFTYLPEANPDVFHSIADPEYALYGQPRAAPAHLGWSPFAQELLLEELQARRGAYLRFGVASRPTAIENLRNFWRFLQLLVIERSLSQSEVIVPTTIPAIRRALALWRPEVEADLESFGNIYQHALQGREPEAAELETVLVQMYAVFTQPDA